MRGRRNKGLNSLRNKFLLLIVGIVLISNLLTAFLIQNTFYNRVRADLISDNQQRLAQVKKNLDIILNQIIENSLKVRNDITTRIIGEEEYLENYSSFSVRFYRYFMQLTEPLQSYEYVHSMLLFTESGKRYCQSFMAHSGLRRDVDLYNRLSETAGKNQSIVWGNQEGDDWFFATGSGKKIVSIILPILKHYRVRAFLVVNLDSGKIGEFIEEAQKNELIVLQLGNYDYIGLERSSESRLSEELEKTCSNMERAGFEERGRYFIFTEEVPANHWKMTMFYAKSSVREDVFRTLLTLFVQVLVVTISAILVGIFIVIEVTDPVKRITDDILKSEETGKLQHISFTPKRNDEVTVLVLAYNRLINKIQENMRKIEEEQQLSSSLYMKALMMQINPHFLSNTMESLHFLVEMGDPRAGEMVGVIGDYYKYSLIGDNDLTSLEEEIQNIRNYLTIMKIRYGSRFDYEIHVRKEYMGNVAVKLSLQPLVENAIYHGIKQKPGKGKLSVFAYERDKKLFLVVYDNGLGIPASALRDIECSLASEKKLKQSNHVGLVNSDHRIRVRFGEEYGLSIKSREGAFTQITIALPRAEYREVNHVQAFNRR